MWNCFFSPATDMVPIGLVLFLPERLVVMCKDVNMLTAGTWMWTFKDKPLYTGNHHTRRLIIAADDDVTVTSPVRYRLSTDYRRAPPPGEPSRLVQKGVTPTGRQEALLFYWRSKEEMPARNNLQPYNVFALNVYFGVSCHYSLIRFILWWGKNMYIIISHKINQATSYIIF